VFEGVPLTLPVDVSKVNPVGSAGEIEYVIGVVPPETFTGMKAFTAVLV